MDEIITPDKNPFFEQVREKPRRGTRILNILQGLVIVAFIGIVTYLFIATPNQVDGRSMLPAFVNDEILLTNRIVQWLDNTPLGKSLGLFYQRGDVIVIQTPELPSEEYIIKRIIAVPGDKISIKEGYVYLNGNVIDETDYLPADRRTNAGNFLFEGDEITIPNGTVFVMGDNRPESLDSRFTILGLIKKEKIIGKVILRLWPLQSFGLIGRGDVKISGATN